MSDYPMLISNKLHSFVTSFCKVTHFLMIKALSKQFFQFVLIHTRH